MGAIKKLLEYQRPIFLRHQMGLMNKIGRAQTVEPLTHRRPCRRRGRSTSCIGHYPRSRNPFDTAYLRNTQQNTFEPPRCIDKESS